MPQNGTSSVGRPSGHPQIAATHRPNEAAAGATVPVNIFKRFDLPGRTEAAVFAVREGLLEQAQHGEKRSAASG